MTSIIIIEVPDKSGRKALYLGDNMILDYHPNDEDFVSDSLDYAAESLSKSLGKTVFTKQYTPPEGEFSSWGNIFPAVRSQVEDEIECLRNTFSIEFEISGVVSQEVEIIDPNFSYEEIVDGLNKGSLITTTWYDNDVNQPTYISSHDDKLVARIISQEIDGSYTDFEITY